MLGWFKKKLGKDEGKSSQDAIDLVDDVKEDLSELEIGDTISGLNSEEDWETFSSREDDTAGAAVVVNEEMEASSVVEEPVEPEKTSDSDLPAKEKGLFQRLRSGLTKTRESFVNRLDRLFLGKKKIDPELLDDLEEVLITADLGVGTTQVLLNDAREKVDRQELNDPQALKIILKKNIHSLLRKMDKPAETKISANEPFVVMVVGVNGVGKTTTIGKIAHKFARSGQKVLLVAADTFRAAAIDQLKIWADRVDADIVAQKTGADPSSVVYDAIDYGRPRDYDVIIIDTAGRLHTKVNLMEELKKIKRVIGKKMEGAPHEVLLVLDATTGQNGISQAKLFHEAVGITGLALTKLDGTAKGGIIVNISHEFQIPIRFIGIGEKMEDLRDFDADEFIEALFGENNVSAET